MRLPYPENVRRLTERFLDQDAVTSRAWRRAVEARAARHAGAVREVTDELPPDVAAYADAVATRAHTITDHHLDELKASGHSEDAIFELTLAAALGAGLGRLERGLEALGDDSDAPEDPA